ncbi:hypothetical protein D6745_01240 [Candidatus Woesearchaeota archaeon]|nr:MAG: hypothetical protein D6745_01240 [Candidatus Woesearchaeota archaeon]
MLKKQLLVLIIIAFFGCGKQLPAENGFINVYFCPRDDCEDKLLFLIEMSNKSIDCAFFDIDLEKVIMALEEKQDIARLVIDNNNFDKVNGLNFVKKDDDRQLSHNKFCVFDKKVVLTGSWNPTVRGTFHNNNNMIIIKSKFLSKNYEDEFEELWQGKFGAGRKVKDPIVVFNGFEIENYFCPEDNCEEKLVKALMKANNSIKFMVFSFTSDDVGDAIIKKAEEGVKVEGVFEKFQNSRWSEYEKMKENSLKVVFDNNKGFMHHKVFIIDEKVTVTGSYNPTRNGNEKNDENMLIIHDKNLTASFLEEFEFVRSQPIQS